MAGDIAIEDSAPALTAPAINVRDHPSSWDIGYMKTVSVVMAGRHPGEHRCPGGSGDHPAVVERAVFAEGGRLAAKHFQKSYLSLWERAKGEDRGTSAGFIL